MGLAALLLPMVPGVIWLWIFYRTDWYEPEPKRLVLATFGLGVLSILPAFGGERAAALFYPFLEHIERAAQSGNGNAAAWPMFVGCFLVIGPCEEVAKFLAVRLFVYRHREFNEPLDGIIYAAAAALGFASLENVLYVFDWHTHTVHWGTLGVRSLLALPGHVIFSTTWGYALGRKRFDAKYRVWPMVLLAAWLHGLYDFLLMYPPTRALIVLYMCLMVPVIVRQIRLLRSESPFAPGAQLPLGATLAVTTDATPPAKDVVVPDADAT
jgi:RsiW-degrading membrane proteinase PrsW (M82 family)